MIEYPELIKSKYIFVFENKKSTKPKKIDYGRKLWKYKTHYRKTWDHHNFRFGKTKKKKITAVSGWSVDEHIELVNTFFPGYILDYKVYKGSIWIDYKIIKGVPASEIFPKTPEFIKKIYRFCVDHYKKTAPFFHGDCTLENIMVDGDDLYLIGWDRCDLYSKEEVYTDLYEDLIRKNIRKRLIYK